MASKMADMFGPGCSVVTRQTIFVYNKRAFGVEMKSFPGGRESWDSGFRIRDSGRLRSYKQQNKKIPLCRPDPLREAARVRSEPNIVAHPDGLRPRSSPFEKGERGGFPVLGPLFCSFLHYRAAAPGAEVRTRISASRGSGTVICESGWGPFPARAVSLAAGTENPVWSSRSSPARMIATTSPLELKTGLPLAP